MWQISFNTTNVNLDKRCCKFCVQTQKEFTKAFQTHLIRFLIHVNQKRQQLLWGGLRYCGARGRKECVGSPYLHYAKGGQVLRRPSQSHRVRGCSLSCNFPRFLCKHDLTCFHFSKCRNARRPPKCGARGNCPVCPLLTTVILCHQVV